VDVICAGGRQYRRRFWSSCWSLECAGISLSQHATVFMRALHEKEKSFFAAAAAAARWPNVHSFHIYLFPVSVPMSPVFYSFFHNRAIGGFLPKFFLSFFLQKCQRRRYLPNAYINTVRRWLLRTTFPLPLLLVLATYIIRPN
jgi:hypothetical protein